jgi:hypothetical protein
MDAPQLLPRTELGQQRNTWTRDAALLVARESWVLIGSV